MGSGNAFQSGRTDYLAGTTARGAILRIEQMASSNSFRGIFGNCEVEIQGTTQLLRTASNQNNSAKDALIVEGVDNKGNLKVSGDTILPGIMKHIPDRGTFSLPSSPTHGQMYIVKGFGGGSNIYANGHPIMAGGSVSDVVASNGTWNIGGGTALLVYDGTAEKWIMVYPAS